jgi:hypothetical protein
MPSNFLTRMSDLQAGLGKRRLEALSSAVLRRRPAAERYSQWLTGHGRGAVHEPSACTHAFLRYPLRVRGRESFLEDTRRRGLDLGDWFTARSIRSAATGPAGERTRWRSGSPPSRARRLVLTRGNRAHGPEELGLARVGERW